MAIRTQLSRRAALALAGAPLLGAQQSSSPVGKEPAEKPVEFLCPMDPDVRAKVPGKCPRCGMKLVAGLPDPVEFAIQLSRTPRAIRAGDEVELVFRVVDPRTGKPVRDFEAIHERLFHLFVLHESLDVFAHEHPEKDFGPEFRLRYRFPKPGMYRLMCDYYPLGATPQITVKTLIVGAGPGVPVEPPPSNTKVTLAPEPAEPIAGMKTRLYFTLDPADQLRPWLGAWGHVLVASEDTIDLIHTHPFIADGSARIQFNVIFPRPGRHRVWVQFDRGGVVNTVSFDVPVKAL